MIDLSTEELISFVQAADLIPGRGHKRVNPATVWRWCRVGVKGPTGEIIKLAAIRIGGRSATSKEAVRRFILAINQPAAGSAVPARTPGQRKRSSDRAARKLERAGI